MKDFETCSRQYYPLMIGNLTVKKPIIQGGMGIGISLGNLAGHVAKEGGLGMISAAQIGFKEVDFETNTKEARSIFILRSKKLAGKKTGNCQRSH